jgi:Trypsin
LKNPASLLHTGDLLYFSGDFTMRQLLYRLAASISLGLMSAGSAHAIVNDTPTTQFAAVGELGSLSGVLVADNWVLTAAHVVKDLVANPAGLSFTISAGTSFADGIYLHPSVDGFPENDIALVHLSSAILTTLPWLYDTTLPNGTIRSRSGIGTVTMVSPQNETPSGRATGTADRVMGSYIDPATLTNYTTNWLVVTGNAHVESGDSGSALFNGSVNDTATLLGVASAQLTETNGESSSAYVLVANYKTWINGTMAPSGQQVQWFSAVPEPGTFWTLALGVLTLAAMSQLRYRHASSLTSSPSSVPHDGDSMVPRSHERDQESHHRAAQAH